MNAPRELRRVVALSGGVGGARFLDGLHRALAPNTLCAIVNTGDDFVHLGLHVSPDVDTVMYTLAGLADEQRGWGLDGETFGALSMVRAYGGPDWFALGDRDLATHVVRSEALRSGESLTDVTARFIRALGVTADVRPMSDAPHRTMIETVSDGTLTFQDWFVRRRAQPAVRSIRFDGESRPARGLLDTIANADVVLVGPSNPYVSIDPILALDEVRNALSRKCVVAVSPIVHGQAVKGPLATMIPQLTGQPPSAAAIALHYAGLLTGIVVETGDEVTLDGVRVLSTSIVMRDREDRTRLAREVLAFATELLA